MDGCVDINRSTWVEVFGSVTPDEEKMHRKAMKRDTNLSSDHHEQKNSKKRKKHYSSSDSSSYDTESDNDLVEPAENDKERIFDHPALDVFSKHKLGVSLAFPNILPQLEGQCDLTTPLDFEEVSECHHNLSMHFSSDPEPCILDTCVRKWKYCDHMKFHFQQFRDARKDESDNGRMMADIASLPCSHNQQNMFPRQFTLHIPPSFLHYRAKANGQNMQTWIEPALNSDIDIEISLCVSPPDTKSTYTKDMYNIANIFYDVMTKIRPELAPLIHNPNDSSQNPFKNKTLWAKHFSQQHVHESLVAKHNRPVQTTADINLLQPPWIRTVLYPHQLESLHFALNREKNPAPFPHIGFKSANGHDVYVIPDMYTAVSGRTVPMDVRGSIIGDDMGLGKTLVALALITSNPSTMLPMTPVMRSRMMVFPEQDEMSRRSAEMQNTLFFSRATLIVVLPAMIKVWLAEIKKHTDPAMKLKVVVVHGKHKHRLTIKDIACADIVLTTIPTLNYVNAFTTIRHNIDSYNIRETLTDEAVFTGNLVDKNKMSDAIARSNCSNNIIRWMHFHRVVFDESTQLKTTKTSSPAKFLKHISTSSVCVLTGTPIDGNIKSVADILFAMNVPYICSHSLSNHACESDRTCSLQKINLTERYLQNTFNRYMIRHVKSDTNIDQLIPPVTINRVSVVMSDQEYNLYKQEHESVVRNTASRAAMRLKMFNTNSRLKRLMAMCTNSTDVFIADTAVRNDMGAIEVSKLREHMTEKGASEAMIETVHGIVSDNSDCSLCGSTLTDPAITPCFHVFCKQCIIDMHHMFKQHTNEFLCPLCRNKMSGIKVLLEIVPDKEPVVSENGIGEQALSEETGPQAGQIKLTTKLEALIQRLDVITNESSSMNKIVIASEHELTLIKVCSILTQRGIRFIKFNVSSFSNDAELFNSSPDIKVFVLSSLKGGYGVSLVAANYMIVMEPLLNKATERQLIGRVHRIGQTRPVNVDIMVTENTIEQKIYSATENNDLSIVDISSLV